MVVLQFIHCWFMLFEGASNYLDWLFFFVGALGDSMNRSISVESKRLLLRWFYKNGGETAHVDWLTRITTQDESHHKY